MQNVTAVDTLLKSAVFWPRAGDHRRTLRAPLPTPAAKSFRTSVHERSKIPCFSSKASHMNCQRVRCCAFAPGSEVKEAHPSEKSMRRFIDLVGNLLVTRAEQTQSSTPQLTAYALCSDLSDCGRLHAKLWLAAACRSLLSAAGLLHQRVLAVHYRSLSICRVVWHNRCSPRQEKAHNVGTCS